MEQEHLESVEAVKRGSDCDPCIIEQDNVLTPGQREAVSPESPGRRTVGEILGHSRATGHEPPSAAALAAIEPVESCETALFAMLRQYPPLMAQLYEAMKTGRWLIVMACKAKDNTPDDLLHSHTMKDFPVDEVVTVLQDHCRHILAEEARRIQRLDGRAANKPRWR